MSVISNNQLAGASGQGGTGQAGAYQIERSLRFNSSDSAYLSYSVPSGTSTTFTVSLWIKRSSISATYKHFLYTSDTANSGAGCGLGWTDGNKITVYNGSHNLTAGVYRDVSAWYYITLSVNAGTATLYVNGVQQVTGVTGFQLNGTAYIGRYITNAYYFDGYMADVYLIDGQALDPTSFTETDANGVLQPKVYTSTYGTKGFHLDFADNSTASALGTDTSGAGNDWTINNISNVDGSVATADGAKPILNTTGPYGGTLGTGVASDPNSSSLYLCAALATSAGVNLTDQQPTGRTTSSLTINNPGGFTSTTTESQYYGGSLNLTGGNYLTVTSGLGIFNGNFTIEAWFRRTGTSNLMTLFDTWCNQTSGTGFYMWWDGGGLDLVKDSSVYYVNRSGTDLPINTWCHVALVRSSNTFTCYVNGSSLFTYTVVDNWTSNRINIGGASTNGSPWVGQIQDVRIYNTAKYTANFSVPNRTAGSGSDSLVDTPTNYGIDTGAGGEVRGNYATLNPLTNLYRSIYAGNAVISNGNLRLSLTTGEGVSTSTMPVPTTGKYYFEVTVTAVGIDQHIYLRDVAESFATPSSTITLVQNNLSAGKVLGVAIDRDTSTVTKYVNGSSSGGYTAANVPYFLRIYDYLGGDYSVNFGQRPFTYTAPSGYKALCTQNLPTPTIADGSTAMDVVTWTGNGASSRDITNLAFNPDLVWVKNRSGGQWHNLIDSVRGASRDLYSNAANAEALNDTSGTVSAFNSNGFTLAAGSVDASDVNASGSSYVAWTWDAGSSTVSNTDGSITSSVRANPSAGFSIVGYTCQSSGTGTIGHGLGVAPEFIITKQRAGTSFNWTCYHKAIGLQYILLNSTAAAGTSSTVWPTAATSTVFTQGTGFTSGGDMSALCFAPVDGYSSFGSYTGNGNTDGPFVYTGFRPRWVMVKCSSAANGWVILDTARDSYNLALSQLIPNLSNAEDTTNNYFRCDLLSNGFKLRTSSSPSNSSGATYIYAAFAENPFQHARAR